VRDGAYSFDGAGQQLALTEVAKHNAIHGLVRWAEWTVLDRSAASAELGVRVWPQPGYPFQLEVRATYTVAEDGLTVVLRGTNTGDVPLPYAVGQHPYLTVGGRVDDAVLTVPADTWLRCDERGLPVAAEPVGGTPYDFRSGRRIGDTVLDVPYADLGRDENGRVVVRLAEEGGRSGVELWGDASVSHLQVFTGDTLAPDRRRQGVAVEPMSAPPDAFNSPAGQVRLEPGGSHTLTWGVRAW
jgi:aldose 1-epimerase